MNAIKCTAINSQAPWFSQFSGGAPNSPVQEGMRCFSTFIYPTRPPLLWRKSTPATLQFPPATFFQFENPDSATKISAVWLQIYNWSHNCSQSQKLTLSPRGVRVEALIWLVHNPPLKLFLTWEIFNVFGKAFGIPLKYAKPLTVFSETIKLLQVKWTNFPFD